MLFAGRFLNQEQPIIECKLLSFEFPNNQAPIGIGHRENPENLGGEFPNEGFTAVATLGILFPDKIGHGVLASSPGNRNSICSAGQRAFWPIDGHSLELQSDSIPPVRQPLAVNNAREAPQVSYERIDHQPFIQISGPLGQDSYS